MTANGNSPKEPSLATRMRLLQLEVSKVEDKSKQREVMLNAALDLFNDLTDWTTTTEHDEAALEVGAILEQHSQKLKKEAMKKAHAWAGRAGVPSKL